MLDAFIERVGTLETYPLRGAVPVELDALGIRDFRQILMGHFRLIYRVAGQKVFVMLIADGRRDMQSLLQQRLLAG
jgi:toxin ParE1/3/4